MLFGWSGDPVVQTSRRSIWSQIVHHKYWHVVGWLYFCRIGKCWSTLVSRKWCWWSIETNIQIIGYEKDLYLLWHMTNWQYLFKIVLSGTPSEENWPGMTQLPDFKPFPMYQPSMSFSQVVPKLTNRGKHLLQVCDFLFLLIGRWYNFSILNLCNYFRDY